MRFEATALRALGAAKLSVTARAGALVSQQSLDVPFSPQARMHALDPAGRAQGRRE